MKTIILTMLLAGLVGVGTIVLPSETTTETIELKPLESQVAVIPQTPKEFLKAETTRQGLKDRDFLIMTEIIQCESGWAQFWERDYNGHIKGEVKVANGNIGLFQINRGAHHAEYEKLGLDPFKEFDNLKYGVMLYKRNGIRDWKTWSGHCFIPALEKKGVIL